MIFRSNRKRPYSSSRHSGSSLELVAEDYADQNFKMTKLSEFSEIDFTPNNEILMEIGPTQTQIPRAAQPFDKIIDSICMQLKTHFDMPSSPKVECLNDLTVGMSRKQATCMFYQTFVHATKTSFMLNKRGHMRAFSFPEVQRCDFGDIQIEDLKFYNQIEDDMCKS